VEMSQFAELQFSTIVHQEVPVASLSNEHEEGIKEQLWLLEPSNPAGAQSDLSMDEYEWLINT